MIVNNVRSAYNQSLCVSLIFLIFLCVPAHLNAVPPEFVITDIRVEGLQRIAPGTVFNYLPVKVGDTFDEYRSGEIAKALFETGFFDDIALQRDGDVLVIIVRERPTIGQISLSGNEDITSEDLIEGLKQVGFAEGRAFDRSDLERLEQELRRQYNSLGKYAVKLESTVTELPDNRVAVAIDISEGAVAKIHGINIVGNTVYDEEELLDFFQSSTSGWFSFFSKEDQYSRQKLTADLESLRSHYLNNGYINFDIESTQVSITPDKKSIYITVNIDEGELFTISEVRVAGDLILQEDELPHVISIRSGDTFSRRQVTNSSNTLSERLGDEGYAFVNVNAIPDIDDETNTVKVTFFIDPGKRAYVRRINFRGNTRTRDEVLRREMRQQESSWVSTKQVERSKVRLQRLGFFDQVNVETPTVPETVDQVDVEYSVTEAPSGNLSLGLGFSQSGGFQIQTSVVQNNFLGSGERVSFAFNNSNINQRFSLGYTEPYYTIDGVSRSLNAFYQTTDSTDANITSFDRTVLGGSVGFGVPITEYNTFRTAMSYENTEIESTASNTTQVGRFIRDNGDKFNIMRWTNSLSFDTRNKTILPDKGALHRLSTEIALPMFGDSLEFYKLGYRVQWFHGLFGDYILSLKGDAGYGDAYSGSNDLPFFENFYAGGPRSVRGYEENTLGPKDSDGDPLGGHVKLIGSAELILPLPFLEDLRSIRVSAFVDGGNVFGGEQSFDVGELRYSAGFGVIWVSPFGLVSASIAQPFADKADDEIQRIQFNIGTSF